MAILAVDAGPSRVIGEAKKTHQKSESSAGQVQDKDHRGDSNCVHHDT
jgi:hypothetical protein